MKIKNFFAVLTLTWVCCSCGKDPSNKNPSQQPDPKVYISGYTNLDRGVYWNGGKVTELGQAFNTTDIALSGSDIYVSGNIGFALPGGGGANAAVYWKNGQMTRLGNDPSYANAITIAGSDIYICGYATVNNEYVAVYWKNGILQSLGDLPQSSANAILVNGSDIYIAGTSGTLAVYWKNGTLHPLEPGVATAMTINGTDLYIAGTTPIGAVYWKNDLRYPLYDPADTNVFMTSGTGIAVSGQNVYVIGYINQINAVLWKNGQRKLLNNPLVAMNISGNKNKIILKDTSVYISLNTADYWKDGQIIHAGDGYASSIAIRP
ncbi:MAG: hypothetical protein GC171_09140 [Terrimonas sp.]|nr:hypothetical protein [Terrimonas sp.]